MSESTIGLQTPTPHNKVQTVESPNPPKTTISLDIKSIIRRKVSSYIGWQLGSHPPLPKTLLTAKKSKPPPKQFLQYTSLQQFLGDEKMLVHLYKQKMDRGLDECLYLYLKTLCLSIDYECLISEREVDQQSSVMIEVLLFVSGSLQETGAERAAFYFASIAVVFCELYKVLHPIGEFLLIMAKIARKLFRYREALLLLKKALEYVWWKDVRKTEQLNRSFRKWLLTNFPQQGQLFADKFEVVRVFGSQGDFATTRSVKNITQLKSMKELFGQYLDVSKQRPERIIYDVQVRSNSSVHENGESIIGLQLQIYNEMSYNFLQLNKKEESRIFAQKYETGYVQSDHSKIKSLSSQLIYSVQRRVAGWHRISLKTFDLLFFVDIFAIVRDNRQRMKSFNQQVILECFQVGFDSCWESFFRKEMFNYQIPLPLQIRRETFVKRKVDGRKFIVRQRSTSLVGKEKLPVLHKNVTDKVEETLILNYRGVGISRLKLIDRLQRFISTLKQKEKLGVMKPIRRHSVLRHNSISQFGPKHRYGE